MKNKTIHFVSMMILLSGCSVFGDSEDQPPMKGERLSVLQLQKSLTADAPLEQGQTFTLPAPWDNTAWPQAGGYPNHTMHNLTLSDKLTRKWSADIGEGTSKRLPLTAQPIVAEGKVYTMDARAQITALNAANGKKIWTKKLTNKNEDEPVITGGISFAHNLLFVTTGYDEVIALSAETGEKIWTKRLPAPARAAPTALNGRVFISTVDSHLVALAAKDGQNLWSYTGIGEMAGLLGTASPAANNDIVIPAFSSGEITALRVENGSVAWSDNLANVQQLGSGMQSIADITAMPLVDRGIIIAVSFSGKLVAIDERTGSRIWQREISGAQTPWISGNTLFILSSDNQLIALDLFKGSIFWIEELPNFEDEKRKQDPIRWTGPLMGSNRLIIAGSNGKILEIDPNTGKTINTIKTKEEILIPPLIADKTLYILSEDGTLMAYR